MGSGPAERLKEIESIRDSLDAKVSELERRIPPLVRAGRKALVVAAGGGAGGAALMVARRIRRRGKEKDSAPAQAATVVQVLPKGAVPIAVGVVAIWAAVRIYEARLRAGGDEAGHQRPAVVTPIPGRQSG